MRGDGELSPARISDEQFRRAAAHLEGLKRGLVDFLRYPKRSITVNFPVEMEDGSVHTFHGYRVLHNNVFGPGKGGIRYHPEGRRGGGHGAGRLDDLEVRPGRRCPSAAPRAALPAIPSSCRRPSCVASPAASSARWATTSVPTPTSPHPTSTPTPRPWRGSSIPTTILHPGRNNRPVVTGKPLELGGSAGRSEAVGRGCVYVTERLLTLLGPAGSARTPGRPRGGAGLRQGRGGGRTPVPGRRRPRHRGERFPGRHPGDERRRPRHRRRSWAGSTSTARWWVCPRRAPSPTRIC